MSDLVETLRSLIDTLHYTHVELHILSPGGLVSSLEYYVTAMLSWQDRGVKFTTRALTNVASASAVMLSLGDDRTASLQSELLYHHARLNSPIPLTADKAAEIRDSLDQIDKHFVSLLARRALSIDRESWKARWRQDHPATSPDASELSTSTHHRYSSTAFAEQASRFFPKNLTDTTRWQTMFWDPEDDHKSTTRLKFLEEVYDSVFKVDRPIPPVLARRIGLIDHLHDFGRQEPPETSAQPRDAHALMVPEWRSIFPEGYIRRADLTRHFMILGETGSGKSKSAVLPIVDAIISSSSLSRRRPAVSCALIVDPKIEITTAIKSLRGRRNYEIDVINDRRYALNVMPDDDVWSTNPLREQAEDILKRSATFVPENDAQILLGKRPLAHDMFWPTQGVSMATTAVTLVLWLLKHAKHIHESPALKWYRNAEREDVPAQKAEPKEFRLQSPVLTEFRNALKGPRTANKPGEDQVVSITVVEPQEHHVSRTAAERTHDRYFGHQIDNLYRKAGLMAQAASVARERSRRCLTHARQLQNEHGFVVQQEADGTLWLDENLPYGARDVFDGFLRWIVTDPEEPWTAETNEVTLGRIFPDGLRTESEATASGVLPARELLECYPIGSERDLPGGFMYTDGRSTAHTVHETSDTHSWFCKRDLTVPNVFRKPHEPTETEKWRVLEQLEHELDDGPGVAEVIHKFQTELRDLIADDGFLYGYRLPDPSSEHPDILLFLSVVRDAVTGPFGWDLNPEHVGQLMVIEELSDDDLEYAEHLAEKQRRAPYQYHDMVEDNPKTEVENYERERVNGEILTYHHKSFDYPPIPDGQFDDENPVQYSFTGWLAIPYAVEALRIAGARSQKMNEYGEALCSKLPGVSSGAREWERRIKDKVADRKRAMASIWKLREGIAAAAPKRLGFRSPGFDKQLAEEQEREENRSDPGRGLLTSPNGNGLNAIALARELLNTTMDVAGIKRWEELLNKMRREKWLVDANDEDTLALVDDVGTWVRRAEDNNGAHYGSLTGSAMVCLFDFSQSSISRTLYFGCEPAWTARKGNASAGPVDFSRFLDGDGTKTKIFVFQPDLKNVDLAARVLKAKFFESVLNNKDRQRPGHEEPLVAYVADEFHRFVTSDKVHGEQSFLDTCRSFGVFCVLASQSRSAISYALQSLGERNEVVESAVSVLSNNTGTKLFFRTTDQQTMQWASGLAPTTPGGQSVASLRPLSSLQPGECLAVVVNGLVKRVQLKQWRSPAKK